MKKYKILLRNKYNFIMYVRTTKLKYILFNI